MNLLYNKIHSKIDPTFLWTYGESNPDLLHAMEM